tara:strand:+ start:25 stop:126 length:102 start_codon:yes stop_codon:yes gene_type:complete
MPKTYPFIIRIGKKLYKLFYGKFVECKKNGKIK